MKTPPQPPELNDFEPGGEVQQCGPLATMLVKSKHSGQLCWAEWIDAAETSDELFASVRRHWQNNVRRQPVGSLKQHEFHYSSDRLTRVIDTPRGTPLKAWMFTRQFDFEDVLETAISLTTCIADWHQMSRVHVWLGSESIFRDTRNRVELRDAPLFDLHTEHDFLALPVRDIVFLSPESSGSLGREISPASDMYSIGALLFGMLAGRPPIDAANASDYLDRQLCDEPPRLRELRLAIPQSLDDVIARLLRRDPRDRYETAAALLHDLSSIAKSFNAPREQKPFAIGTQDIRTTLTEASFVGREAELESLQRSLDDARSGLARLQFITGSEPSCRRSLVDEIALRAESYDMLVLRGSAHSGANAKPLQSLEAVLASIVSLCDQDAALARRIAEATGEHGATLAELLPALSRLWPGAEGPAGPGAHGSRRAAIALEELFAALAQEPRGLTLLFDDLERADEMTRIVVRSLAYRVKQGRGGYLLCIVTGESSQSLNLLLVTPPIELGPISDIGLELHLQSAAGKVSDSIKKSIIQSAGGSASMASAILSRLIDLGAVQSSAHGWISNGSINEVLRGDESIGELLERQVHAFSPSGLRMLSAAAVAGQSFELKVLAHVTGARYSELLEVITDALGRRLLWREAQPGCFRFAHQQIHDQLYRSLSEHDRNELHLKIAAYLEAQEAENVFDLAYHYDAAGDGRLALLYALQAARTARQRFSLPVAQQQLEIARRWVASDDQVVGLEVAEGLGEIHLLAGRYEQAAAYFKEAIALAQTPVQRARVQQQIGELAFKRGRFTDAALQYEQALAITGLHLPSNASTMLLGLVVQGAVQVVHSYVPTRWIARKGRPAEIDCLRLQLLSRLSHVYWFSRNKLWTLGNHLRSLNEAERFSPSATLAAVYSEHGPVMSLLRWFRRANRYAERSLKIRRLYGDRWGQGQSHHYHAVVKLAECRFQDAIKTAARAVEMLRQTGDFWEMNMARYQAANAMYRTGRLAEAAETAAQVFYSGREIGDLQATGISLDVWARSAPRTLALETVAEEAARTRPDAQSHAQTQLAYAVCLLHHNRVDDAIRTLQDAIDRCRAAGHLNTYISPCYAWLCTALRRRLESMTSRDVRLLRSRFHEAQWRMQQAVKIARAFPADQAHCLREVGMVQCMLGNINPAARLLMKSLASAQRYVQPIEELETLKVLQHLHNHNAELLGAFPAVLESRLGELTELHENPLQQDSSTEPSTTNLSLADRFVTVLQSGRRIAQALSANAVYTEASESARRLLRGQHVDVVTVRRQHDELLLQPWPDAELDKARLSRINANAKLISAVARSGQSGCDLEANDELGLVIGSAIAAPIAFRGNCVAVILVTHNQLKDLYGKDELRIADFVATLAGAALENADGFLNLQQMNDTLEQRVLERTQAAEQRARQLAESNQQLRDTEDQLREAIVQANAANEAKGRFLATISHEIRTPLNGILGMTRLAQQSAAQQRQAGYLDVVQESGQSLLRLINDLLDFSKLEAGKMELERIPVDPQQLIGEVARLMATSAWQKGVELVCDVGPDVPQSILGDPSRLRQIVMNLIGNAIKFTDRGFIAVIVRTETPDDLPARLLISVQDSGIGIAADKQTKIFESFSQADSSTTRRYGGTGLGLAICKELVEMMMGTIEVQSEQGVGSTFTVAIPLEAGENPQRQQHLRDRRVAVIDPLLVSRRAIERALCSVGAAVTPIAAPEHLTDAFFDQPWDLVVFGCTEIDHVASRCAALEIPCLFLAPGLVLLNLQRGQWSAELRKPIVAKELIAAAQGLIHRDPLWRYVPSPTADSTYQHPVSDGLAGGVRDQADEDQKQISTGQLSTSPLTPRYRILVAEDGVINQEVIVGLLHMQGYEVVVAKDGLEASEKTSTERFDVCLMDVDMPEMDGIEATRLIRKQMLARGGEHLPIIAMTAHCGDQIWESCKAAGMDAYLPKPIQPGALFETIERFTSHVPAPVCPVTGAPGQQTFPVGTTVA